MIFSMDAAELPMILQQHALYMYTCTVLLTLQNFTLHSAVHHLSHISLWSMRIKCSHKTRILPQVEHDLSNPESNFQYLAHKMSCSGVHLCSLGPQQGNPHQSILVISRVTYFIPQAHIRNYTSCT